MIEFALKKSKATREVSSSEIWSAGNDDTRRLPFSVGINYINPTLLRHTVILTQIVYDFGYTFVNVYPNIW
jgi:hypothetical protein